MHHRCCAAAAVSCVQALDEIDAGICDGLTYAQVCVRRVNLVVAKATLGDVCGLMYVQQAML